MPKEKTEQPIEKLPNQAPTHLNAYYMELQEAEKAALQAHARVEELKREIDTKLAEDGKKPEFYDSDGKPIKGKGAYKGPAGPYGPDAATPDHNTNAGR